MYALVDLGGTNLRVAFIESLSKPRINKVYSHKLKKSFTEDFDWLTSTLREDLQAKSLKNISIGTPGTFDYDNRYLKSATYNKDWIQKPFVSQLEKEFNCSVHIDNDAVVSALGEAYFGNSNFTNFVYVTWGTGVGGASVQNKSAKKLVWKEYLSDFEASCGGKNLQDKYRGNLSALQESEWNNILKDFMENIVKLSDRLDCKNFIVGGGIAFKQSSRLNRIQQSIKEEHGISLKISVLGENINLLGACALILQNSKNKH